VTTHARTTIQRTRVIDYDQLLPSDITSVREIDSISTHAHTVHITRIQSFVKVLATNSCTARRRTSLEIVVVQTDLVVSSSLLTLVCVLPGRPFSSHLLSSRSYTPPNNHKHAPVERQQARGCRALKLTSISVSLTLPLRPTNDSQRT
jgi:hypothetical protein